MTLAAEKPARRSLFPLVWIIGAVGVACLGAGGPVAVSPNADYIHHDTYYVVAHFHFSLSLAGALLVMAGLYFLLDTFRLPYRHALAWGHFGIMTLGVCLILVPMGALALGGLPRRYADYPATFATLSRVAGLGYAVTFASLAVFVWLIVDALVRRKGRS